MSITPIIVPKWGLEMAEGTLVCWHFAEGQRVSSGDELLDLETDKIVNSLEAAGTGTLRRRLAGEGDTLPVGALIGVLADESVDEIAIDAFIESFVPADTGFGPEEEAAQRAEPPAAPAGEEPSAVQAELRISPIAKRLAEKLGVDLSTITGTGRNGRISKQDVELAAGLVDAGSGAIVDDPTPAPPAEPVQRDNPYRTERLTGTRRTIAKRLTEAKQSIPHFYLDTEIRTSRLVKAREELNAEQGARVSLNDFVIRAAALALRQVPEVNVNLVDEEIRYFEHADICVAIATDGGLVAPVLRAADTRSVLEIGQALAELVAKSRSGELGHNELRGGTFSVSNLGMYGVSRFDAIINPPQGAILAIGAATERVIVADNKAKIATIMTVTLSCDHRVIDGARGAQYLQAFKGLIENPGELG